MDRRTDRSLDGWMHGLTPSGQRSPAAVTTGERRSHREHSKVRYQIGTNTLPTSGGGQLRDGGCVQVGDLKRDDCLAFYIAFST